MQAQVRAVGGGAVLDVELEAVGLEKAGVVGEEAEKDAHEEALKVMARVAAGGQRVVEIAEDLNSSDVDGVFVTQAVLPVTGDEGKVVKVLVEILEQELVLVVMAGFEKRQVELILGFEIIQRDALKIRKNDEAGKFLEALLAGKILNVAEGL